MTEAEQRAAVVAEAVSWYHPNPEADPRPTPFHLGARVKGVGVDCAQFILASVAVAGIGMGLKVQPVTPDWFMHHEDRRIIDMVEHFCHEVEAPQPGDLVLYFIGKSWAHMAIVKEWPIVIQAKWNSGVQMADALQGDLKKLERKFFSPWAAPPAPLDPAVVKHLHEETAAHARVAFEHLV